MQIVERVSQVFAEKQPRAKKNPRKTMTAKVRIWFEFPEMCLGSEEIPVPWKQFQ